MQKLKAFTLAEILITMGIVGVIAALTVPDLVNDYQNKAMAVKIRKSVNDFENTIDQYVTAEGKQHFNRTTAATSKDFDTFIKENFRVVRTCDAKTAGCFASENYISIDGQKSDEFRCTKKSYILADSSAICMKPIYTGNSLFLVQVWIDVNGPAEPNIGGRDMFFFWFVPSTDALLHGAANNCVTTSNGAGCITKLQENNWKMDY